MVNRIRLVKVHICILGTIRKLTPSFFGKKKSRDHIMSNLHSIMENVRVQFDLSKGDMPDANEFARCLDNFADFSVFPPIDNTLIRSLDRLIESDIPDIVNDADIVASEVRLGRYKKVDEVKAPDQSEIPDESQTSLEETRSVVVDQELDVSNTRLCKYVQLSQFQLNDNMPFKCILQAPNAKTYSPPKSFHYMHLLTANGTSDTLRPLREHSLQPHGSI